MRSLKLLLLIPQLLLLLVNSGSANSCFRLQHSFVVLSLLITAGFSSLTVGLMKGKMIKKIAGKEVTE